MIENILKRLVVGFAENPVATGKILRDLLDRDPAGFAVAAIPILGGLSGTEHPGGDYLVTLLLESGFLPEALADSNLFRIEEAVGVAKAARRIDPQVTVRLALRLGQGNGESDGKDGRLLELIEAIGSTRSIILPLIARMSQHPDPKVRSKAALMVGRGNRNSRWVKSQLTEEDPRVRANAVEALWGLDTEDARAVLWEAAGDPHNRVVGNALLGLYRLAEPQAISLILNLARHDSDVFRATAAWLMGECEDPRFMANLAGMALAGDARVRPNAIRALTRIKLKIARMESHRRLRLQISRFRLLADGSRCCSLAIATEDGRLVKDIPPTRLVLWEDSRLVAVYGVEQPPRPEPLTIAFGIPRASGSSDWQQAVGTALADCLRRKRDADSWSVVRYSPGAEGASPQKPVRAYSETELIESAIEGGDETAPVPGCALDTLELMLRTVAQARGGRALIFIADPGGGTGTPTMDAYRSQTNRLPREARAARVTIHGILPPQASPLVEDALRSLCRATDGLVLRPSTLEEVPEAVMKAYFSCLDRYQLVWRPPAEISEEAIASESLPAVRVQLYSDQGYGEDNYPPAGTVPAESK